MVATQRVRDQRPYLVLLSVLKNIFSFLLLLSSACTNKGGHIYNYASRGEDYGSRVHIYSLCTFSKPLRLYIFEAIEAVHFLSH